MIEKANLQKNAILYAIEKYPGIGRTKLMKFVFFTDLVWYNIYNETLLEDEYTRMPRGPVPAYGYSLTENSNENFTVEKVSLDPEVTKYNFSLKHSASREVFNDAMLKLMDSVINLLKRHSVKNISEFCHKFRLWKLSKNGYKIPKKLFKLNNKEIEEIEALTAFSEASQLSKKAESDSRNKSANSPEDAVPDEIIELQMEVLNSEDC
jgi:hypothetical protein